MSSTPLLVSQNMMTLDPSLFLVNMFNNLSKINLKDCLLLVFLVVIAKDEVLLNPSVCLQIGITNLDVDWHNATERVR